MGMRASVSSMVHSAPSNCRSAGHIVSAGKRLSNEFTVSYKRVHADRLVVLSDGDSIDFLAITGKYCRLIVGQRRSGRGGVARTCASHASEPACPGPDRYETPL